MAKKIGYWKRLFNSTVEKHEKELLYYKASPKWYPLSAALTEIFITAIIFGGFVAIITFLLSLPIEVEGSCNSGFIGIDFSERFVFNESSIRKELINYNPQKLDIKNIDGINCNYKVKIPLIYYDKFIDKFMK